MHHQLVLFSLKRLRIFGLSPTGGLNELSVGVAASLNRLLGLGEFSSTGLSCWVVLVVWGLF